MSREETIRRINEDLKHLPEPFLGNLYEAIGRLRRKIAKEGEQKVPSSEPLPFVDEIERVKEQSRNTPGRADDPHFT